MGNTVTEWKSCLYGGAPGGNRVHRVHLDKMTNLHIDGKILTICEDCADRKRVARKAERTRKIGKRA